jgi:C4-dicarboxylate transporter DctQ subunit
MDYVQKMHVVGIDWRTCPIEQWIPRAVMPLGLRCWRCACAGAVERLATGKSDSLHLADEAADALKLKAKEGPHEHRHPVHHAAVR